MCSASCAWCRLARRSHNVVKIDVPNEPAVMRAKLNRPDAAGMRSGDSPERLSVTSGMKNSAMRRALDDRRDQQRLDVDVGVEVRAHEATRRRRSGTPRSRTGADRPCACVLPDERRQQDREQADRREDDARPSSPCSPCTAAATAAAARGCRRRPRRRATSRACSSRSCAARTATGRRSDARRSAPRRGRTRSRRPRRSPARRSCVESNQSRSLPLSSMICSAPTQSDEQRRARRRRSGTLAPSASRACGR